MISRRRLWPAAVMVAVLALAAQGCSDQTDTDQEPSATPELPPSPVIALPSNTPAPIGATPFAVVIGTSVGTPTTVLGATMTPPPACTNDAQFITDVSIPDGTSIVPGTAFDKTWQIRNTGTCPWTSSYRLTQVSDTAVQALTRDIPLPPVDPGATVEITLKATLSSSTPLGAKSVAKFELRDPDDKKFGTSLTIEVVAVLAGTEQGSTAGTVSGLVWHDYCHPGSAQAGGQPDQGNCVVAADGSKIADGIFQPSEKGIAGIKVELHQGTCTGPLVTAVTTGSNGSYGFTALSPGAYCVLVNALDAGNASILVPGTWTSPATDQATAVLTMTLGPGQSLTNIDFGWDFQYD